MIVASCQLSLSLDGEPVKLLVICSWLPGWTRLCIFGGVHLLAWADLKYQSSVSDSPDHAARLTEYMR